MKTILLILSVFCFKSYSQDLKFENFELNNGSLVWQKIYKTEFSNDEITKSLKSSGLIKKLEKLDNNSLIGEIENLNIDYKGYGKTFMNTELYISKSYFKSFFLIEFKEGRYRITLKEMKFEEKNSDGLKNKEIIELKESVTKNKNTDFKDSFKRTSSGVLNFTFDKIFELKKKNESNW